MTMHRYYILPNTNQTLCFVNHYGIDTSIEQIVDDLESWDTLSFLGIEKAQANHEYQIYYVFGSEDDLVRTYIHLPIGKMAAFEREMGIVECTYACVPLPILARYAAKIYQEMYRTSQLTVEESNIIINDTEYSCYAVTDGITTIMSAVEMFDDHMIIPEYQIFVSNVVGAYDEYFTIDQEKEFDEKLHDCIINLYK